MEKPAKHPNALWQLPSTMQPVSGWVFYLFNKDRVLLDILQSYQTIHHTQTYSDNSMEPRGCARADGLLATAILPSPTNGTTKGIPDTLSTAVTHEDQHHLECNIKASIRKIKEGQDKPKQGNHMQVLSGQFLLCGETPE